MKRVVVIGAVSPELIASLNGDTKIIHHSSCGAEMVGDVRNEDGFLSRLPNADLVLFPLNVGGAHPRDFRHGAMLLRALKDQNHGQQILVQGPRQVVRLGATETVTIKEDDVLTIANLERALA